MGKKRFRNRATGELEKLKKKVQSELGEQGREITFQENVGEKMSDVVEEFLAPYEQSAQSTEEYRRLIGIGILAWNAALVQGEKREQLLSDMLRIIAPNSDRQTQEDFYGILREMIERKEKYFATNRRFIVNFELTETPTGLHLSIASTPK